MAMSAGEADSAAPLRAKRLHFAGYVLDLERGSLLRDGNEIVLRPKTFAVLRHLVETGGRLISKDELFAAVWTDLAVTDDALVQSIGELRRALGDDGARLIRTVPRRGYRFEAQVSAAAPADSTAGPAADVAPPRARLPHRWVAALALAALLTAGGLWGVGTGWRFWSSPTKSLEFGAKPAIAVLPFLNQSDDAAREYFPDGLTQDVINGLGRFSELTVMSWNAVLPYQGKPASPAEVARHLGVRYEVEGSVRRSGDRVRVAAQTFPTLAEAQAAAGPAALATEVAGKAWLFTLGAKGAVAHGGKRVAEIGPVAPVAAPAYLLRVNLASAPSGARTKTHSHPGSEAFYVLAGELSQKTPHGTSTAEAGQSMPGHASGTPMEVSSSGTAALSAPVMFVVDASKPFSSPAKLD
jgi:DNA-binding winged helix-turn-helix (wHTH) protein/TolB-like protein/uncharacterized RmlC-like cupin family protein